MASLTESSVALPLHSGASATIRIEPPSGLFELRLDEVRQYRELLYFFVWRDIKIRYKQTAIGVLWVALQPLLTMLVFALFFGRLAKLPSDVLPYPVFYFAALVPWTYFSSALQSTTNVIVDNPIRRSIHHVALYTSDRSLVWGTAIYNLELSPGTHALAYTFPSLPLRPGPYNWLVSLFDDMDELDGWDATPEMVVATENHQHRCDECVGVLNVPASFSVSSEHGYHG